MVLEFHRNLYDLVSGGLREFKKQSGQAPAAFVFHTSVTHRFLVDALPLALTPDVAPLSSDGALLEIHGVSGFESRWAPEGSVYFFSAEEWEQLCVDHLVRALVAFHGGAE